MEMPQSIIPLLIFLAEVCVVTLGTLRIIFIARGLKFLAPLLGFFEILSWLFAMKLTMQNLNDWYCYLAFAGGFTLGNFLGILIEKSLAMGTVSVRIITHRDAFALVNQLRSANFGVTCIDGQGALGKVQIVMTIVKRKQLAEVTAFIERHHPNAFYAVDELQEASEGIFPNSRERHGIIPLPLFRLLGLRVSQLINRQPVLRSDAELASGLVAK